MESCEQRSNGDSPADAQRVAGNEPAFLVKIDALADDIATLAAHMTAAEYRLLCKIREFDQCDGWYHQGAKSCAHWLNWRIGLGLVAARERVRVARALGELPLLSDAMKHGRVSYSKVRALTRIATPEIEKDLLYDALTTTASQVEKMVRLYRQAFRPDELTRTAQQQAAKHLDLWWDDDGMLVIRGRLPPEEGALVEKAIGAARRELFERPKTREQQTDDSAEASAATEGRVQEAGDDHAVQVSREPAACGDGVDACGSSDSDEGSAHASVSRDVTGAPEEAAEGSHGTSQEGSGDSAEASGGRAQVSRGRQDAEALARVAERAVSGGSSPFGARAQVVVHADAEVLANVHAAGRCELDDETAIAADTLRRIACDSIVVSMIHDQDGAPLGPGRRTRTLSNRLLQTLWERDRGCQFPGCTCTRGLQAHHIQHWADGGPTDLSNTVLLCRFHHFLVHEIGYTIEVESESDRRLRFLDPRGQPVEPTKPPPAMFEEPLFVWRREHERLGINELTTMPDWDGETADYDEMLRPYFARLDTREADPTWS